MKKNKYIYLFTSVLVSQFFISCNEDSIDRVNSAIPYESIGGYDNSDEIAASNLITKVSFENNITDSKNGITDGTGTAVSYAPGIKGQAYKGSSSSFIAYSTVASSLVSLKNITVSMWINTTPHTGGAQSLFMLPKTTDFWGNIFTMVEGTGPANTMLMKNHIQKDVTPSIPWSGQFIEHGGSNLLPNMFGSWKHVVWMYNGANSTYSMFIDGKKLDLPASIAKRYASDPQTGGVGYGDLANSNVSKFIIGGFQQHLGAPWSAPDGWMLNYTGLMDEFRIYNAALTDNEVVALYKLERDNR
ncbi:LamG-like jellyroll fold domain-containing protein [Flavobacterium hiemivividum]|uniref:LamG domain-containing protein n=1 Tax=Flavobacterium hiemivividum TaxID=2541734 RepID=A0A4R5CS58_9FLAO|nr:LamG-like jellyroll fold domain-containing protein [Flavobacterium hiemivividum]TDE01264.1 LamG domain-containing protein [Flavobacterium hiemivividum]